ncbi:hypothetical protein HS088_TW18G00951 [Tripterygium wilfordii]|uniref:Pentatricopeptide repeat-containing protein n=1 Tax=Tripterygium wilfordii TaxID=458696 RepID=A0A7J7CDP2_TRIWF|nr:hypothetical protein HS088_TW18G00951 [Tripterygium wilfordii]
MYGKCGNVEKARLVLIRWRREMVSHGISLLSGYSKNGQASEAPLLFDQTQDPECKPTSVTTYHGLRLSACAYLGCCHMERKLHSYISGNKIKIVESLCNALMDMYAKSGDLEKAVAMFKAIHSIQQNVTSWNLLISGYDIHGRGKEALKVFWEMLREGVEPDYISFTSILAARSHGGLIDEGRKCFADMKKSSVKKPEVKHYASMVICLDELGFYMKRMI